MNYCITQFHVELCMNILSNKRLKAEFGQGLRDVDLYERATGEEIPYLAVIRNHEKMLSYKRDHFTQYFTKQGLAGQALVDAVEREVREAYDPPPNMWMTLEDWLVGDAGSQIV